MSWADGVLRGFDTETSGVDTSSARIVTAAIVDVSPDRKPYAVEWILDPACDIPDEAVAVHGWTREKVIARVGGEGMALRLSSDGKHRQITADAALFEMASLIAQAMGNGTPVVAANAAFDLTLLEAELGRSGIDTLASRPSGIVGVVDPMVIDKAYDAYRKTCYKVPGCVPADKVHACSGCRGGKHKCGGCGTTDKTLSSLYRHYLGRPLVGAHGAADDALAAVRVAAKLGSLWPQIARWKLGTLHEHEVTWRREQMNSLRDYFERNGIEHDGCDPSWPVLRTAVGAA